MIPEDVGAYLATEGHGTVGVSIFQGFMPNAPDAAISFIETAGFAPDHAMGGTSEAYSENGRIQVLVRGAPDDYAGPRAVIRDVHASLDAVVETDLSGTRYHRIEARHSPAFLDLDDSKRVTWVCNYDIMKDPD